MYICLNTYRHTKLYTNMFNHQIYHSQQPSYKGWTGRKTACGLVKNHGCKVWQWWSKIRSHHHFIISGSTHDWYVNDYTYACGILKYVYMAHIYNIHFVSAVNYSGCKRCLEYLYVVHTSPLHDTAPCPKTTVYSMSFRFDCPLVFLCPSEAKQLQDATGTLRTSCTWHHSCYEVRNSQRIATHIGLVV